MAKPDRTELIMRIVDILAHTSSARECIDGSELTFKKQINFAELAELMLGSEVEPTRDELAQIPPDILVALLLYVEAADRLDRAVKILQHPDTVAWFKRPERGLEDPAADYVSLMMQLLPAHSMTRASRFHLGRGIVLAAKKK